MEIEEMAHAKIDVCLTFYSWNPTDLTHRNTLALMPWWRDIGNYSLVVKLWRSYQKSPRS